MVSTGRNLSRKSGRFQGSAPGDSECRGIETYGLYKPRGNLSHAHGGRSVDPSVEYKASSDSGGRKSGYNHEVSSSSKNGVVLEDSADHLSSPNLNRNGATWQRGGEGGRAVSEGARVHVRPCLSDLRRKFDGKGVASFATAWASASAEYKVHGEGFDMRGEDVAVDGDIATYFMASADWDMHANDLNHVTEQNGHVARQEEPASEKVGCANAAEPVFVLSKPGDRSMPVNPCRLGQLGRLGPLGSEGAGCSNPALVLGENVAPRGQFSTWGDDVVDVEELATAFLDHHKRAHKGRCGGPVPNLTGTKRREGRQPWKLPALPSGAEAGGGYEIGESSLSGSKGWRGLDQPDRRLRIEEMLRTAHAQLAELHRWEDATREVAARWVAWLLKIVRMAGRGYRRKPLHLLLCTRLAAVMARMTHTLEEVEGLGRLSRESELSRTVHTVLRALDRTRVCFSPLQWHVLTERRAACRRVFDRILVPEELDPLKRRHVAAWIPLSLGLPPSHVPEQRKPPINPYPIFVERQAMSAGLMWGPWEGGGGGARGGEGDGEGEGEEEGSNSGSVGEDKGGNGVKKSPIGRQMQGGCKEKEMGWQCKVMGDKAMSNEVVMSQGVESLIRRAFREKVCSSRDMERRIQRARCHTRSEAAMKEEGLSVSLLCPLSKSRLQIPARGSGCPHWCAFDLRHFLQAQAQTASWRCPVCQGDASWPLLEVNGLLLLLLNSVPAPVEDIILFPDATWRPGPSATRQGEGLSVARKEQWGREGGGDSSWEGGGGGVEAVAETVAAAGGLGRKVGGGLGGTRVWNNSDIQGMVRHMAGWGFGVERTDTTRAPSGWTRGARQGGSGRAVPPLPPGGRSTMQDASDTLAALYSPFATRWNKGGAQGDSVGAGGGWVGSSQLGLWSGPDVWRAAVTEGKGGPLQPLITKHPFPGAVGGAGGGEKAGIPRPKARKKQMAKRA